jgi:hypothetical protein
VSWTLLSFVWLVSNTGILNYWKFHAIIITKWNKTHFALCLQTSSVTRATVTRSGGTTAALLFPVHQRTCHVNPFTFLVLSVPHPNFSTISEMDRRFVTFIGQGCDVTRRLWRASNGQIAGSKASDKMAPSLISYAHNETRRRQKWADSLHAKLNYRFGRYRLQKSASTAVVTRLWYGNQRRLNTWLWRGKGIRRYCVTASVLIGDINIERKHRVSLIQGDGKRSTLPSKATDS